MVFILVSAATEKDAEITLEALSAGAFDCVPKRLSGTSLEIAHIRNELVSKIRAAAQSRPVGAGWPDSRKPPHSVAVEPHIPAPEIAPAVVAMGLSTGGPKALELILPKFPEDFPVSILIVQHMPSGFTAAWAQRLNSIASIHVKEAAEGEFIRPATAYIAPAGVHMRVVAPSNSKAAISLDKHPESACIFPRWTN